MITTSLAMLAMAQTVKPTFTMILVAGNEHPIIDMKDLDEPASDKMIIAIQKMTKSLEARHRTFMLMDGASVAERPQSKEDPLVFSMTKTFSPARNIEEVSVVNGKTIRMNGFQSASLGSFSTRLSIPRQDRVAGAGFSNTLIGEKGQALYLSPLASILLVNTEDRVEYKDYFVNLLAISNQSVDDTKEWLANNAGKYHPTMVLCASGRPQSGHRDILAFPPSGVILTYTVTFDKRWSAVLKDIIRVQ